MRLLFCGDVLGRAGREAVIGKVPGLRRDLNLDLVVINGENAAHGFGITAKLCDEFFQAGVDVITLGNHAWDQKEIISYIDSEPRLLRPRNYPPGTPGRGAGVFSTPSGKKVLIVQVMGRLFMDPLDDPFPAVDQELNKNRLGGSVQAVLVDVHAEASSEKMAMGQFCDGRASMVVGSHSHIPTADAQILPKGTAYQTDAGMCGDYDSVIGMKKEPAIAKFIRKMPGEKLSPAEGEGTLCAIFVETDDRSGLARRIEPIRLGGRLAQYCPSL